MPDQFSAFTAKADGRMQVLTTKVQVSISQFFASQFGITPSPEDVEAIWDTGASGTVLSERLVKKLNLPPIGKRLVSSCSESYESSVYIVDIALPNNVGVVGVQVTEAKNIGRFDVLIGIDIITIGDLSICNYKGKTSFSFRIPSSSKRIDYVEEANKLNFYRKKTRHPGSKKKKRKNRR